MAVLNAIVKGAEMTPIQIRQMKELKLKSSAAYDKAGVAGAAGAAGIASQADKSDNKTTVKVKLKSKETPSGT